MNQAFAASRGDLILLLNSDVHFRPGSLSALVRLLRARSDVAGVAPLYLNPDGTVQQHYYRLPTFRMVLSNSNALLRRLPPFRRWIRSYRMVDDDFSSPRPFPNPRRAACSYGVRASNPIGFTMSSTPSTSMTSPLPNKLNEEGHSLWMTPDAQVVHEHGASTRLLGGTHKRQHLGALVRYLKATQPRPQVLTFQALALVQGVIPRALGRSGSLPLDDLWHAVSGDPGPLPQAATPPARASEPEAIGDRPSGAHSTH